MCVDSVATGYGQPPCTLYDGTLAPLGSNDANYRLPEDIEARLLTERFCNNVTKALYSNHLDPVGLPNDAERSILTTFLAREFQDLEEKLKPDTSCMLSAALAPLKPSRCIKFRG